MGVVVADFSKIEVRLKALSVRFWGIIERGQKWGQSLLFILH